MPNDAAELQNAERKTAAAEYIAIQASRLARMANANELALVAHIMDMAVLEAWREASGEAATGPGGGEV